MAQGWADEVACYSYPANTCDMTCAANLNSDGCGHYTQMVWENSLRVGCATNANNCGSGMVRQLICLYSPYGNFNGQLPYTKTAASNLACNPTYTAIAPYCTQSCQHGSSCTSFNYCSCTSSTTTRNFCEDTTSPFPSILPTANNYYGCTRDADCSAFAATKCCPTAAFGVGKLCNAYPGNQTNGCPDFFSPVCSPACASGSSYCVDTNLCMTNPPPPTTTPTTSTSLASSLRWSWGVLALMIIAWLSMSC
jgi:hypothetical protein